MTDKPTPTDAELWQLHMQLPGQHKDPIDFARVVLARWGQPAHSGEPVAWRSAVLDLIDDCPGLTMGQDRWLSRRVKELDFPSAPRPAPSAAVALSDDLRDRFVAISEAIADQDDLEAQAMIREILKAPQANSQPAQAAEPVSHQYQSTDGTWHGFMDQRHYNQTVASGGWPIRALYAAPQPVAREPLTDEQIKTLMQAHRTAMLMTCKARVPECGEFAAIAQDLDWLCESFGIKGGQHGTE